MYGAYTTGWLVDGFDSG